MRKLECPQCNTAFMVDDRNMRAVTCPVCALTFKIAPETNATGAEKIAPETDNRLKEGEIIGGCRIEALLGVGGMGRVFRARHTRLERDIALKILSPGLVAKDPKYAERFLTEAKMGAQIDHTNVVHIYDVGEDKGLYYIQSAYVTGNTLKALIEKHGALSIDWALDIMEQCLRGVAAVHKAGLLHRDIKPTNFMISDDGHVKLMDFGLARPVGSYIDMTSAGYVLGTPAFMSPEQCEGEELDARADIYSLGLVFWTLLTGRKPFIGNNALAIMKKQRDAMLPSIRKLVPDLPEPIDAIIQKMAAKSPQNRYYAIDQILEDIQAYTAGKPLSWAIDVTIPDVEPDPLPRVSTPHAASPEPDDAPNAEQSDEIPAPDDAPGNRNAGLALSQDELLVDIEEEDITDQIMSGIRSTIRHPPRIVPTYPDASTANTGAPSGIPPADPVSPPSEPAPLIDEKNRPAGYSPDRSAGYDSEPLQQENEPVYDGEVYLPAITDPNPTIRMDQLDDDLSARRNASDSRRELEAYYGLASDASRSPAPPDDIPHSYDKNAAAPADIQMGREQDVRRDSTGRLLEKREDKPLWMQSGDIASAGAPTPHSYPETRHPTSEKRHPTPRASDFDPKPKYQKGLTDLMRIGTAERESVIAARRKTAGGRMVVVQCIHCREDFSIEGKDIGTTQPCPKCGEMTPYEPPGLFVNQQKDHSRLRIFLLFILAGTLAMWGISYLFKTSNTDKELARNKLLEQRLKEYYSAFQRKYFEDTYPMEQMSFNNAVTLDQYVYHLEKRWKLLKIKGPPTWTYTLDKSGKSAIVIVTVQVGMNNDNPHDAKVNEWRHTWIWLDSAKNWFRENKVRELDAYRQDLGH